MYKRNAQGWSKHLDFIIMDEICLQIALILAAYIRLRQWPYTTQLGKIMAFALVLADAVILVLNNSMHNVLKRSFFRELYESFKHGLYVFAIVSIYMFATQTGVIYSGFILINSTSAIRWRSLLTCLHIVSYMHDNMLA